MQTDILTVEVKILKMRGMCKCVYTKGGKGRELTFKYEEIGGDTSVEVKNIPIFKCINLYRY
jgi:hypothetical protein